MKSKHGTLALALGLALAGSVAAETIVLAEPEVRTIVTKAGYAEPVLIKRDQDLWRVRSVSPAGEEVTIFVDESGKLLGARDVARTRIVSTTTTTTTTPAAPRPLDATTVTSVLADAGFHGVHDVELKNGVWKAEADDITGEDFEVHVDASTGMIVHIEDD
jgi:membrane protein implicated in regulation of membrane protease activity